MFRKSYILTDLDEVCFYWIVAFKDFILNVKKIVPKTDDPQVWDLNEWLGCSKEESDALVHEFNTSDAFGSLTTMHGAAQFLTILAATHKIVAISSCGTHGDTIKHRKANIASAFPNIFSEIHCVKRSPDKREILKMYKPSYWIEDKYDNAVMGMEEGHHPIMMVQPYNIKYKETCPHNFYWAHSWMDIFNYIENHKLASEIAL